MSAGQPSGPQATLVGFAVRFPAVVVVLACSVIAYGIYILGVSKYDVFPEFAPPFVGIQTEAPGLTPEQVEVLVTRPIENAINGVPGVQMLRSTSIQGLSTVAVYFDPSSDIYRDRQVVAEQLSVAIQKLPQGLGPPTLTPLTSSTGTVLAGGLTSATRSQMELRTAADWTVRPRLLSIPGVADVVIYGGDIRSIQIKVHPDQLIRYNLSIDDVLTAARRATGVRGAGFVDTKNQRIVFQTEGQSLKADDIARTVLLSAGASSLTLADVAKVVEAPPPAIGSAAVDNKRGVIFYVQEQYGADTIRVTKLVELALQKLRPSLQKDGVELHDNLFKPATFISTATTNVRDSLIVGGALVIIVIFLFLFDLRTAAISCTAIPLSLLAAAITLKHMGVSLNTMTLGGLAISIGVVVDDAVIGVENIVRRLRENSRQGHPKSAKRVVLQACLEVRSSVVYATFAVILVVLPVMALPGIAGRLFGPLALAYLLAVLASLVVALTVTPALSVAFLPGHVPMADPPLLRRTRSSYQWVLKKIAYWPRTMIMVAIAFTMLGTALLPFFGASFIPELKEGHFIVHMVALPGTSLEESMRIGTKVTQALLKLSVVRSVAQWAGRAEKSTDTTGPHYSEFEVDLRPGLSGEQTAQAETDIRKALSGFVGVNFAVNTFLTERIEETLSGYTAPVAVNIFGNDLDQLDQKAEEVAKVLNQIPHATDVQIQSPRGLPLVTINLRKTDLERWGFDPVAVLDLIRTTYQGDVVGQTYQGNQVFDVIAILDDASRTNVASAGDLPLRNRAGVYIQLKQIADIRIVAGRYQVSHEGTRRLQSVTANVSGTDVASFVKSIKAALAAKVQLPNGVYIEISGAAEAQSRSQRELAINSIVAGIGIVLLLSIVTRNRHQLLLVLVNLPFALVGGVLAVYATGGLLSLGAMVGFVTLFGITLRNSILMIAHYQLLVQDEGAEWGPETAIRGAGDRVIPILMTSIVTGLGVLPLALGMDDPGREIEGPMAVVILGGLLTSTTLNLLVLPTLALRYGRFVGSGRTIDSLP